jgi:imidazole glycerol-phosphate synthase subunit HisH
MIVIVDYGLGNLLSIKNMLKKVGCYDVKICNDHETIAQADKLILPGVGRFDYGMQQLHRLELVEILQQRVVQDKIPVLGICLGAQLLTKSSEEGQEAGLGWIDAHTVKFDKAKLGTDLKVPHMGWSEVIIQQQDPLFKNFLEPSRFYFVHSYHIVCKHEEDIAITAHYGYEFTAGFKHENITGVQFHPEKSHKFGMQLLRNFYIA